MERIFRKREPVELTPEEKKEISQKLALYAKAHREGKFTKDLKKDEDEELDIDSILLR